ncbi:MAG: NAD-binding protein [Defluviitaleaceae bacterium]|nr:NAD-binding protein [Defluviitaleaceae bacterium]
MPAYSIIGGDKRNLALAQLLVRDGHEVKLFGFEMYDGEFFVKCKNLAETLKHAEYIIAPTPLALSSGVLNAPFHGKNIYLEDLFRRIKGGQVVIAGYVKPEAQQLAARHGVRLVDMLHREDLLMLNAIPTAEGALQIAIAETEITLHNACVMVVGYGRIGKVLSRMLQAIGAKVTVITNSKQAHAEATAAGHLAVDFAGLNEQLPGVAIIFNTVPKILLDEANLPLVQRDSLTIDLASPPYGTDAAAARELGLRVLFSGSLPGKVAPVTTATYIKAAVEDIVRNFSQGKQERRPQNGKQT